MDVFDFHRTAIAKKTLRMTDAAVNVMQGMTKSEAREYLAMGCGWSVDQIAALEKGGGMPQPGRRYRGTPLSY